MNLRPKTSGGAALCLGRIAPSERPAEDFAAERDARTADEDAAGTSDEARVLILRFSAERARWLRDRSRHDHKWYPLSWLERDLQRISGPAIAGRQRLPGLAQERVADVCGTTGLGGAIEP
jgi:hypothetical protein